MAVWSDLYLYLRLSDEDIILISDPDIFLSIPSYLNVLQSSHQAWLFFSEIMFYGYLPWESLIALTTANWRCYIEFSETITGER